MKLHALLASCIVAFASATLALADVLYSQPPAAVGTTLKSSYWDPDGSDYDEYVWDAFTLSAPGNISEIRWRGAYPGGGTTGGNITRFRIAIYASIPGGSQPDLGYLYPGPLVRYTTSGNANEVFAGTVGGTNMYDYHYTLPQTFLAAAGTTYWVQIEAWQAGMPTWGLARGSGGNNSHFHRAAGAADAYYYFGSWDAAFTLIGTSAGCASPVITQDPVPVTVCYLGADVSFTVAATTTVGTLSYQWRRNGNPVTDGPNGGGAGGGATISGARTATLTIAQPSYYAQPGIYDCAVSSPCGVTNSAGAQLDVAFGPPAITSGPVPAAVCLGGTASFSVTPDNPALTYMWRKDWGEGLVDGPTASGSEIWGAATATMTIINIQPGDVATYGCSVINGCWANSDGAALTIAACGCGLADIAGGGAAGQSPDGIVDGSDFIAFINSFSTGDTAVDPLADVAGGGPDGLSPDGIIDGSDFIAFINAFAAGC